MYNVMQDFGFELPTKIEFGIGSIKKLKNELRDLNADNVLIVTDKGVLEAGIVDKIVRTIDDTNINYSVYDEVEPNPKDYNVEEGAEKAEEIGADALIGLGGGSSIDCAKSIGVLLSHQKNQIKNYEGKSTIKNRITPLITIPTTAGTGSEVTFSSVITDTKNDYKMTIKDPLIAPKLALMDPELTKTLPPEVTASTGVDALTHAIEGYTCNQAEPLSDAAALYSIELINEYLRTAYCEENNLKARSGMLLGSLLGGIAFSHSDVASVHAMAESLGGLYDAPHGVCNSVLLPYVMEYNMDYAKERYARIGKIMNAEFQTNEEGAKKAVQKVNKLTKDLNLPEFSEIGKREKNLEKLSKMAAKNISTESNPRPMNQKDYLKVFKKASKN